MAHDSGGMRQRSLHSLWMVSTCICPCMRHTSPVVGSSSCKRAMDGPIPASCPNGLFALDTVLCTRADELIDDTLCTERSCE
jgi:hypothetical protein